MTRDECIKQASSYIKSTPYPNPNQFTKWFYGNNTQASWCGIFVDYVIKHDLNCDWLDSCSNFAYVPTIYNWAKQITKPSYTATEIQGLDTYIEEHSQIIGDGTIAPRLY